jgi:SAM-dependent methyltransferase
MNRSWTRENLLDASGAFMTNCILGAAAELGLFDLLAPESLSLEEVTAQLQSDPRATRILLDALAALELLEKENDRYRLPPPLQPYLTSQGAETVLPMICHRMSVARAWVMLAWTVKAGIPAPRPTSLRGPLADTEAFVLAMHVISAPLAQRLVAQLRPLTFRCLLDVGGATGTWTEAFLNEVPGASAIVLDLPAVIEVARRRLSQSPLRDRIRLVSGDYLRDPLPGPVDFAWVSAICHQHSREENRLIFRKIHEVLSPGGSIAIRDIIMEPSRIRPVQGALFAVNMLANTPGGNTYTFDEYAEDLRTAGFVAARCLVSTEDMNSVIVATKP